MGEINKNNLKAIFIFIGIMIIIGFLASFLQSRSPLDLFLCSVGLMIVILGFHYERNAGTSFNNSKMQNNPYMGVNGYLLRNIKVTPNYFWAMLGVLIFQCLIIYYLYSMHPPYPDTNYNAKISIFATVPFLSILYFYIQIRESDLKYIGKMGSERMRINNNLIMILAFVSSVLILFMSLLVTKTSYDFAPFLIVSVSLFTIGVFFGFWKIIKLTGNNLELEIKDNGYLVCDKCNRYYELQADELSEDFSDKCECGGKLQFQDRK